MKIVKWVFSRIWAIFSDLITNFATISAGLVAGGEIGKIVGNYTLLIDYVGVIFVKSRFVCEDGVILRSIISSFSGGYDEIIYD